MLNQQKHGISFAEAAEAFNDRFSVERLDNSEDYGEARFIHLGCREGELLTVVFTERGEDRIRIISARCANDDEKTYYLSQNAF